MNASCRSEAGLVKERDGLELFDSCPDKLCRRASEALLTVSFLSDSQKARRRMNYPSQWSYS